MTDVVEPIPFSRLIDEAIKHTRRHFKTMFLPVALPVAILNGLIPVVQVLWFNETMFGAALDPVRMFAGMGAFVFLALLIAAVGALGSGALIVGAVDALDGRTVSMARAWRTMVRPRVFGTCLLAVLCLLLGCGLCLLPGVFLALLFAMTLPVMIAEGLYGTAAIARSSRLAFSNPRGDFASTPLLKIFLILFLGWLLSAAVGIAISLPLVIVQQVLVFRAAAEGKASDLASIMKTIGWMQVPANMLNALVHTAVETYMAFAIGLFYFDLRRRREGSDLEAAIRELARGTPEPPAALP